MANVLDNIISWVSPSAGYRREAWRHSLDQIRNYDAGGYDRINSRWTAYNQSAEQTDRYSRDVIRARARDLERNSDMANSVIKAFERNVIGLGWTLQANTYKEKLNNQIEELWKDWCKKKNCDVTGTQSFNQMLRMIVTRKKVDGGILLKKCYTSDGILPFQLQTIEVDELDDSQAQPHAKENKVCGGIEFNKYNKPVGYWIKQYSVDGFDSIEPIYVPAKDIMFLFTKRRPSQVREISDFAPTITRIRDANEYMTAVSVKERIMACLAVFIKKSLPVSGIGRGGVSIAEDRKDYDGKSIVPGMIKELNAGDEVQVVNPAGQGADSTDYIKLQQRLIGAGQGLSYEATSRDMSQSNYSSARQGSIEDGQTFISEIELIQELLDEVYETFIISAVLSGKLSINNFWENKNKYFKHKWVAAPKKWIDPLKEANSQKIALQTGQKTFMQIAAENGKDWKEQLDEIITVLEYGKEKGIDLGGVIFGQNGIFSTEESVPGTESSATGEGTEEGTGKVNNQDA